MASSIYFNLVDNCMNPLTGSKVSIRPYQPPLVYSSSLSYGGPTVQYTDVTGSVYFPSVIPGIFRISFTNAGSALMSNGSYQNFDSTIFYINALENGNQFTNGMNYLVTSTAQTGTSASFAYTIDAANKLFAFNTASGISTVQFAVSASWAPSSGGSGNVSGIGMNTIQVLSSASYSSLNPPTPTTFYIITN